MEREKARGGGEEGESLRRRGGGGLHWGEERRGMAGFRMETMRSFIRSLRLRRPASVDSGGGGCFARQIWSYRLA